MSEPRLPFDDVVADDRLSIVDYRLLSTVDHRLSAVDSQARAHAVNPAENDFDAEEVLRERPAIVIQEIVGRHLYSF